MPGAEFRSEEVGRIFVHQGTVVRKWPHVAPLETAQVVTMSTNVGSTALHSILKPPGRALFTCLILPTSLEPLEGSNRAVPTLLFPAPDRLSVQEVFAKHMTELCWEWRSVTSGQTSEALACEGQLSPHFSGAQRGEDTGARLLNPSLAPTG